MQSHSFLRAHLLNTGDTNTSMPSPLRVLPGDGRDKAAFIQMDLTLQRP